MMLKMVLLPQPDGPIRLTKRPCGIESVIGASAWKTPVGVLNVMLTSSTQSFGAEDDMGYSGRPCRRHEIPHSPGTISQKACQPPSPFTCVNAASIDVPRPPADDGKLSPAQAFGSLIDG